MGKPLIIGNWKANKTLTQAKEWAGELAQKWSPKEATVEVILAPAFIHLAFLRDFFADKNLPVKLCAQDLSSYTEGAYTGEISAKMLSRLADYVIIGHSERRNYFQENEEILKQKVERAQEAGLSPIYCVFESGLSVPDGVEIIAYEPLFAVGTGQPDTPQNASTVAGEIKKRYNVRIIYGGSVKQENARDFLEQQNIGGLLIGGASLSASEFVNIIQNAV
ncbi:MAG: triose-phosphate isomerase [bacterium]|nr:triose-phosphate isomerase [bacterium]